MIDFLRGPIVHLENEYVIVDMQGIGYRVFCPNPYAWMKEAGEVTIYTHHYVREDAIQLFGFPTRDEQKLFRKLIEVSGIGPRVALGILSGGSPEGVVTAIYQENITFLTKLPGIGKKTAQRMILDLKDKLGGIGDSLITTGLFAPAISTNTSGEVWPEVRDGLKALGYTDTELDRIWQNLKHEVFPDDSADDVMKRALKMLYTG